MLKQPLYSLHPLHPLMLVLIVLLSGCATTQYGNHVEGNSSSRNTTIASDAAFQLMQLYPPASTRFNLQHPTTDAFGAAFIENLRMGGYAIQEHVKTENTPNNGTELAYILDQSSDVFRLSLMIDKKILTRAYRPHENKIQPAGSWVLKE